MTNVIIATNSLDSTASALVDIYSTSGLSVFRWNVDLIENYEIRVDPSSFSIDDLHGRRVDLRSEPYIFVWRKPFTDTIRFLDRPGEDHFVRAQVSAWLRYLIVHAKKRNASLLVEPYGDHTRPKLLQLEIASDFFPVPNYEFSIHKTELVHEKVVTKALQDALVNGKDLLFTSVVEAQTLFRPFPWFLQTPIFGGVDVTVVYIDGECFWYECAFVRNETNVDWRTEINTQDQSPWSYSTDEKFTSQSGNVRGFMQQLGLAYGRLDFIEDTKGILWFLECNPNGEFGWLDDDSLTLHRKFAHATVRLSGLV